MLKSDGERSGSGLWFSTHSGPAPDLKSDYVTGLLVALSVVQSQEETFVTWPALMGECITIGVK